MALTLPTVDEFTDFWGDEADDVDEDRAGILIDLSADLLWLATGLSDDPTDPRLLQLVKYAICDMAIYLYVTRDNVDADYSPFQSERIGSYNYSKTYMALSKTLAKGLGSETGVPLFDRIVAELLDEETYGGGTIVAGQRVYREYYVPLAFETYRGNPDQDAGLYWG